MNDKPIDTPQTSPPHIRTIHGIPLVMVNSPMREKRYKENDTRAAALKYWQQMCLDIARAYDDLHGIKTHLPDSYEEQYSSEINAICENAVGLRLEHFDILACTADVGALTHIHAEVIQQFEGTFGINHMVVQEKIDNAFSHFPRLRESLHNDTTITNLATNKAENADFPKNTPAYSIRVRDLRAADNEQGRG